MRVRCPNCNTAFAISQDLLSRLVGKNTKIRCESCSHSFEIQGELGDHPNPSKPLFSIALLSEDGSLGNTLAASLSAISHQRDLGAHAKIAEIERIQGRFSKISEISSCYAKIKIESETQRYSLLAYRALRDGVIHVLTNIPEEIHGVVWISSAKEHTDKIIPVLKAASFARGIPLLVVSHNANESEEDTDLREVGIREKLSASALEGDQIKFLRSNLIRARRMSAEDQSVFETILQAFDDIIAVHPAPPKEVFIPLVSRSFTGIEVSTAHNFTVGMPLELVGFGLQASVEVAAVHEAAPESKTQKIDIKSKDPLKLEIGQLLASPGTTQLCQHFRAVIHCLPSTKKKDAEAILYRNWKDLSAGHVEMIFYTEQTVDPNKIRTAANDVQRLDESMAQISGKLSFVSPPPTQDLFVGSVEVEIELSFPIALRRGFYFSLVFVERFSDPSLIGAIGCVIEHTS
jgi:predicted Zn finger-like uncharacterized protein